MWIEESHTKFNIRKQCELLGINRSSLYYRAVGINDYNLLLMNELDKQYTETPFYGVLKMTHHLASSQSEARQATIKTDGNASPLNLCRKLV